jgi:S1-C subfamily serine protease
VRTAEAEEKSMAVLSDWQITKARQPNPGDYTYDLDQVLTSVVGLRTTIPEDAFTAETLGTERAGSGVVIGEGLVLTIGYLITEAEEIWMTLGDGSSVAGHPLAYDQETGFGIVQALGRLGLPALPLGRSAAAEPGTPVVVAGGGGRPHSVSAVIVGRQEFAGYWEYVLDDAIFTAPAHPFWGGTALIGPAGDLLGVGSLQLEQANASGETGHLNMVVPIDLLKPILDDLLTTGRAKRPPRPWLGVFATEIDEHIYIAGLSSGGPAERAGLRQADMIVAVGGRKVSDLADCFRSIWALGTAGVEVPLTIARDGRAMQVRITSADRNTFLKAPRMHS